MNNRHLMRVMSLGLSMTTLFASIPVSAAAPSETITTPEIAVSDNAVMDNEQLNMEQENVDPSTDEIPIKTETEDILEPMMEEEVTEDDYDYFIGNDVDIYALDASTATAEEITEQISGSNDAEVAAWVSSLSDEDIERIMDFDTPLSQTVDIYADNVAEFAGETHFETGLEYYEFLNDSNDNLKATFKETSGYYGINWTANGVFEGTSIVKITGFSKTKDLTNKQTGLVMTITNAKHQLGTRSDSSTRTYDINTSDAGCATSAANPSYGYVKNDLQFVKPQGTVFTKNAASNRNPGTGTTQPMFAVYTGGTVKAYNDGSKTYAGVLRTGDALQGNADYNNEVTIGFDTCVNINGNMMGDYHATYNFDVSKTTYTTTFSNCTGVNPQSWVYGTTHTLPAAPTGGGSFTAHVNTNGGSPVASAASARAFLGWQSTNAAIHNNSVYGASQVIGDAVYGGTLNFNAIWGNATVITPAAPTKTYTVTYNGAGGGTPQQASSIANVPFAYWACNGITRGANEALEIGSDVTLDAVYSAATVVTLPDATPANFTVTFDGNGVQDPSPKTTNRTFSGWNQSNTGGIAPANTYYTPTSDVTLNAIWTEAVIDLPTVSRLGYTFGGWTSTTGANVLATATSYKPTSNETLTAVWTANNYTIKYDANGGEGTMLPQTIAYDAEVTLSPSTYTKADYTFKGWATTPNGQIVYKDGEAVKNLSDENGAEITLYAVYIANEYVVSFSAGEENSVAGKSTNTIADKVIKMDEEFTLPTPERKFNVIYGLNGGYMLGGAQTTAIASAVFKGWTITKPSLTTDKEIFETVVDFMPNASVSNITSEGVLTLYPVWDMESATVTLPNAGRTGYIFQGWVINGDTQHPIPTGEVVVIEADTTIEAKWDAENPTPTPTPNNEEINNQINQIIETLNGIKKVSDLTSSQVTQLTSLLTSVYNFDSETATDIINAIKNSTLTEEEKLELLKAISSGSISEEMRKKLVEMIENSTTLTEDRKKEIIAAINGISTLSVEEQKKILELLSNGSSVSYVIDGVEYLFNKNVDGTLTISLKTLNGNKEVVIPDSVTVAGTTYAVTEVASNSFKDNTVLEKVTMGNNVTKIGDSAFEGCKNLKTVVLSQNIASIGNKAFKNCEKLQKITIPKSVLKIGYSAFENCKKLKSVTFNEGLIQMGSKVFYKCSALTKVKLPKSLLKVGNYGFAKCTKLKSVSFAAESQLRSLGVGIFSGDTVLEKIKLPAKLTAIPKKAFKGDKKLASCTGGTGVTKIGESAFEKCTSLKKFTVNSKVQSIQKRAFYGAKKLGTVTIKSKALTSVGSKAFKSCKKGLKFKVPNAKIGSYSGMLKGKY